MNFSLKKPEETTVVVGMSGGVDSSVCAALLKEQGYNVIGLFMKNWDESDENGVCQSTRDYEDVARVCDRLEIPYYSVEFVQEYWDNVFSYFLEEYKKGHTPNPDILCNREIKFKVFFDHAMKLGADFLATGHYCQVKRDESGKCHLLKGTDGNKDQTYFVYTLQEEILQKVIFPIGHLEKPEVRELAQKYDLATSTKKDSTGICFIGERNFKNFLGNYLRPAPGEFRHLDGTVVGRHSGVQFYTLGQRKGLGLGGPGEPWFVVGKDVEENVVYVERGDLHPAMLTRELVANDLSWVGEAPRLPLQCRAKVRYRQDDQECLVLPADEDSVRVVFKDLQRAVTPRQAVVFYLGDECLGGGSILEIGESLYQNPSVADSTSFSSALH